jgi:hypothetical protein
MQLRCLALLVLTIFVSHSALPLRTNEQAESDGNIPILLSCVFNSKHNLLGSTFRDGDEVLVRHTLCPKCRDKSIDDLYVAVRRAGLKKGRLLLFSVSTSKPKFTLSNDADFSGSGDSGWMLTSDPLGGVGSETQMRRQLKKLQGLSEYSFVLRKGSPPTTCDTYISPTLH